MDRDTEQRPKGARARLMGITKSSCPFCARITHHDDLIAESPLCVALSDTTPLNPGHTLIIPRRHESDFLCLSIQEQAAIMRMAAKMRAELDEQWSPDGFNVGVNVGEAGGQTIGHAHLHLIPRYWGDVADPRGGVRCLIPERTRYWESDEARYPPDRRLAHPDAS